jgi:ferredoxin-thioredoxin reductase catalytic subunit
MSGGILKEYSVRDKKLWRCHVCNDVHYGRAPPLLCPTCAARNAFILIDWNEGIKLIGDRGGVIDTRDEVIDSWRDFTSKADAYDLTDDEEMYLGLAEGVLENQKNHDLKYCPCRMKTGDPLEDLNLICPCHFEIQSVYKENGECWCGLFVKRREKNE